MKTYSKIIIAVLILVTGLVIVGCKNNNSEKEEYDRSVYENIKKDGVIEVGYINYPPGFIVDPNSNEFSGIFQEVIEEIARRNDLKINYKEPVSWATMIQDVELGRVDLIANPVWATDARKKSADFTQPVYYSPIGVYVREDDTRFDDDYSAINNSEVRIAAVQGEINNEIGEKDFPNANLDPFTDDVDVSQLFLEIKLGRKDVTFAEPMFAYDYIEKNPNTIKNIGKANPIRNYPNSFMIKKGETGLLNFLNTEIDAIVKDGTVEKILSKYVPFDGAVILVTDSLAIEKQ